MKQKFEIITREYDQQNKQFEAKHKQIAEDEETRKIEINSNFEEHLKSIREQMKEESDKQSKEDNSIVAETKKLTETYNSLVKETDEKTKQMK
jgi:hypothetical protein